MDNEVLMYCRSARSIIDVDLDSMSVELKEIEKRDRRVGTSRIPKRSRSQAGLSDNVSVEVPTFEEARRAHPSTSSAAMPMTPLSVDRNALGCYSPTRMADRDPEERTQYKKVHDDVVDYNSAEQRVVLSALELAKLRAMRKHREAFEEQQRKGRQK